MSEIIGSSVPRHQPRGPVQVNPAWRNRLLSLIYFGGGAPADLIDQPAGYTFGGSARLGAESRGVGLETGAGTLDYIESTNAMAGFSGNVTVIVHFLRIDPVQSASGFVFYGLPAAGLYTQLTAGTDFIDSAGGGVSLGESILGTRNRTLAFNSAGTKFYLDRRLLSTNYASSNLPAGAKNVRIGGW